MGLFVHNRHDAVYFGVTEECLESTLDLRPVRWIKLEPGPVLSIHPFECLADVVDVVVINRTTMLQQAGYDGPAFLGDLVFPLRNLGLVACIGERVMC